MGAVPSRESTSLFSYFRGSYEVGMVPLTKYYFGSDAAVDADDANHATSANAATTASATPPQLPDNAGGGTPPSFATTDRDRLRQQLRQQLLLMRRDPAVLYANAREVDNILDSLLHGDSDKEGLASEGKSKKSSAASTPTTTTTSKNGLTGNVSPNHPCSPVTAAEEHGPAAATAATSIATPLSQSDGNDLKVLGNDIKTASREELLRREYWSVMPNDNFSEQDLDHFLELVEETLFDTNEALLAADSIRDIHGDPTVPSDATTTPSKRPFLPVPCALCLAYPDGKERDGAFSLDGRVVNIIGYFGLMTPAMQDAFKVVKRLPSRAETEQAEAEKTQKTHHSGSHTEEEEDAMPTMYLNTAILTSAGDRTLERVLVLAAVMLRQQFHTVGRRHLLQAKLDQLLRRQLEQPHDVDPQMVCYLQSVLAIPSLSNPVLGAQAVSADGVQLPYFDPLLEVPLPSIPRGIYRPTHYINAASTDPPRRHSSMNSLGRASYNGSTAENSFVASASASHLRSLPPDAASSFNSNHRVLLYPQGGSMLNGVAGTPSAIVVPGSLPGSAASPPLLMPGSMALSQSGPSGSFQSGLPPSQQQQQQQQQPLPQIQPMTGPAALPLDQCDEDAITMAFCRRMEKIVVFIETASNNYSALKSLTENFAFLHCQIVLDESLTTMELIDMPGLTETPSFKPLLSATTPVTTLKSPATTADTSKGAAAASGGSCLTDNSGCAAQASTTKIATAASGTTPRHEANSTDAMAAAPAVDRGNEATDRKSLQRYPLSPHSAVVIKLDPALVRQATMWASSFFHCPTRLPTGSWVKYKLKDECDQLRHVLQNKDMLIAHWRKTDGDRAARYLGVHTGRLLEHVRALQAETEEARALPADHWSHRPLFVNQDGRKYALFQSRYGTMLIGVRAFSASSNPSAALSPSGRSAALASGSGTMSKPWQSGTSASMANNSAGGASRHSNSLNQRNNNNNNNNNNSSTQQSHNASRTDHANNNNNNNNNMNGSNTNFQQQGAMGSYSMSYSGNGMMDGGGGVPMRGMGGVRVPSSQPPHSFFMTSSGTYLPYMAPPPPPPPLPPPSASSHDAHTAGSDLSTPHYGMTPLMMPQGPGGLMTGEVPHYYAAYPLVAMAGGAASYGGMSNNSNNNNNKQQQQQQGSMSISHVPPSPINPVQAGMMFRAPPPPPPPPHQHQQQQQQQQPPPSPHFSMNASGSMGGAPTAGNKNNNNSSNAVGGVGNGSSNSAPATMLSSTTPPYFDPSRVVLSASVNATANSMSSPLGSLMESTNNNNNNSHSAENNNNNTNGGVNVLHLVPQSRIFGANRAPAFFASPQQQQQQQAAAATSPTSGNGPAEGDGTAFPASTSVPHWQSTTTSALPTKPSMMAADLPLTHLSAVQNDNKAAAPGAVGGVAGQPQQHLHHLQPRGVDQNGAPLHVTGVNKTQTAALFSPAATGHTLTSSNGGGAASASLWSNSATTTTTTTMSGLHNPSPHTGLAASGSSLHGASAMTPLFSANSIWGPDQPQYTNSSSSQSGTAAAAVAVSGSEARADPFVHLGHHVNAQSLVEHKPSFGAGLSATASSPGLDTKTLSDATNATPSPLLTRQVDLSEREGAAKDADGDGDEDEIEDEVDSTHNSHKAASQKAALTSSLPWALQQATGWASADDVATATPHYLLRGTEMLDVDDEEGDAATGRVASTAQALSGTHPSPTTGSSKSSSFVAKAPQEGAMSSNSVSVNGSTHFQNYNQYGSMSTSAVSAVAASPGTDRREGIFGNAAPRSSYVPMDPRIPTPPQRTPASPPVAPVAVSSSPHSLSSAQMPPQNNAGSQSSSSAVSANHPALPPPPPNQLLYYTVANGVPMLVQPPATPGGVAMAFPLSGPVNHGDAAMQSYALSLQQQQQHQQQQMAYNMSAAAQAGAGGGAGGLPFTAQQMPQNAMFLAGHASPPMHRGLHNPPASRKSPTPHAASSGGF